MQSNLARDGDSAPAEAPALRQRAAWFRSIAISASIMESPLAQRLLKAAAELDARARELETTA